MDTCKCQTYLVKCSPQPTSKQLIGIVASYPAQVPLCQWPGVICDHKMENHPFHASRWEEDVLLGTSSSRHKQPTKESTILVYANVFASWLKMFANCPHGLTNESPNKCFFMNVCFMNVVKAAPTHVLPGVLLRSKVDHTHIGTSRHRSLIRPRVFWCPSMIYDVSAETQAYQWVKGWINVIKTSHCDNHLMLTQGNIH